MVSDLGMTMLGMIGGVVLVWLGWRGRRVDDHPICRGCGFDLVGLPEDSEKCSECGRDVRRKGAVRVGHRKRRWGLTGFGLALATTAGVIAGTTVWTVVRKGDFIRHKPVWWLVHDGSGMRDLNARDGALKELRRRIMEGELSERQMERVVDRALAIQADRNVPWDMEWGDLIDAARDKEKLSYKRWIQYLRQGLELRLDVRPQVRRGAGLPLVIRDGGSRLGSWASQHMQWEICVVKLNGIECSTLPVPMPNMMQEPQADPGHRRLRARALDCAIVPGTDRIWGQLKEGDQTARVTVAARQYEYGDWGRNVSFVQLPVEIEANWRLTEHATVKVNSDPSLREKVSTGLRVSAGITPPWVEIGRDAQAMWLDVDGKADFPRKSFACEVFVRTWQQEWAIGKLTLGEGDWRACLVYKEPDISGNVYVILRPSPSVAEETVDVFEVWDGDVVIKDVKVVREERGH